VWSRRLWLDVKERDKRARALYVAEGFVAEGVLRECLARIRVSGGDIDVAFRV
jgi:hypothetical protein